MLPAQCVYDGWCRHAPTVVRASLYGRKYRALQMLKIATKFVPDSADFLRAWIAGFRYAEFWLSAELLQDVTRIAKTARKYPLEYVPHFPNKKNDIRSVKNAIKLYQELNCQAMVIHQPMFDEWKDEFASRSPSIRLAVENHQLNEKEFWQWAENNPGLNLDVEHLWKFTLKDCPLDRILKFFNKFLDRFADKLYHIHLPGYLPGEKEHRPMYCSREFVFGVWELLENIEYHGLVVSEINAEYQTEHDLRMDVLLFELWWQTHCCKSDGKK